MSKSIRRPAALALGAAAAMLLLLPAAGQAATIFGSQLKNDPTEKSCELVAPCTIVSRVFSVPPNGDPYSGGAPVNGVITKFRTRAYSDEEPGQITFRVANLTVPDPNNLDSALATAAGTGPTITLPPIGENEVVDHRGAGPIADQTGPAARGRHHQIGRDHLQLERRQAQLSVLLRRRCRKGKGSALQHEVLNELLVQASIEPDADNDGFGDETQDQCPTQATTQGPCDTTPPGVTGLKVSNGKKVSYNLTEAATVSFKLEKKSKGRKVGRKCVKQTKKNKAKKACPLFKQVGAPSAAPATPAPIGLDPEETRPRQLPPDDDRARRGRQHVDEDDDVQGHREEEEKEEVARCA